MNLINLTTQLQTKANNRNNNNQNNNNNNNSTMMDSYRVGNAGAIKRIGTPHPHDVLSGRGGAINSHQGNVHFREWVCVRRERYNLARSKAEKARIATEVMDLVQKQSPPGRFLQRDQSSSMGVTWWVEVDEIKAMAKTSQGLREGAPSIRAAHKDELKDNKKRARKSKPSTNKRTNQTMQQETPAPIAAPSSSTTVDTPMPALEMSRSQAMRQLKANVEAAVTNTEADVNPPPADQTYAPLMSTTDFENAFGRPAKRSRYTENMYLPEPHIVKPDDETPPLGPMPSPVPLNDIPALGPNNFPVPAIPKRETSFRRSNSLALSDIGNGGGDTWGDLKFVNPFEGDNDEYSTTFPPPLKTPFDHQTQRSSSVNTSLSRGTRSRNRLMSESIGSDLSDLLDGCTSAAPAESDFSEGMKGVYDATSGSDEPIPTHLYPYRAGSFDLRGSSDSVAPQLIS